MLRHDDIRRLYNDGVPPLKLRWPTRPTGAHCSLQYMKMYAYLADPDALGDGLLKLLGGEATLLPDPLELPKRLDGPGAGGALGALYVVDAGGLEPDRPLLPKELLQAISLVKSEKSKYVWQKLNLFTGWDCLEDWNS